MWIQLTIKDYECPHCEAKQNFKHALEFEEEDTEGILEYHDFNCQCGTRLRMEIDISTSITILHEPLSKTPSV